MKKNEKKLIIVLIIILAIVVFIKVRSNKGESAENQSNPEISRKQENTEEFVDVLEDGTKLNTSKALSKERTVNGLKLTNIQLAKLSNGTTMLFADVENTTSSATDLTEVSIKLLDKDGNVLTTLKGLIAELEPGETTQLNIGITSDFANAYDFEIEEVK